MPVTIPLPAPVRAGSMPVEAALQARRSVRSFQDAALSLKDAGQLLWAAQGVTSPDGRRTAPSAGALYPLEVVLVAGKVTDLAPGVYRYLPSEHRLVAVAQGDKRAGLAAAAHGQDWLREAPATVAILGVYERTAGKYGERAPRYVAIEVGAAAENVALQAVALGLGTVFVGAFEDEQAARILGGRSGERPLLLVPVGKR